MSTNEVTRTPRLGEARPLTRPISGYHIRGWSCGFA